MNTQQKIQKIKKDLMAKIALAAKKKEEHQVNRLSRIFQEVTDMEQCWRNMEIRADQILNDVIGRDKPLPNGCFFGPMGQCFAIPTKDFKLKVLPLHRIQFYVRSFLICARVYTDYQYLVTEIGCGLAGYKPEQIAPLFLSDGGKVPPNVWLPRSFWKVLGAKL